MNLSFSDMVVAATATDNEPGHPPYRWQEHVAGHGLPELIDVETGAGKTEGIVLPWLWRRRFHPDPAVRAATPRWLVLCLPLRVLTEQVEGLVLRWLSNLGLAATSSSEADPVLVHIAMGGREGGRGEQWRLHPERDAVVIGTVDMLLSRALNRGYAMSRFAWPIDFGLLHNGTHWVFDEVQLLGPALPTSLQLDALRRRFGTAIASSSTWMSATVDPSLMTTVDRPDGPATAIRLGEADRDGLLGRRLAATRRIEHLTAADPADLAAALVAAHRPGTLTVAVMNTVEAARRLHREVERRTGEVEVILLHSRFRPDDRRRVTEAALAAAPPHGRIVVSTQVLEAGVDISAATLFTEAAPWPSVVQRAGRCNRYGEADGARLLWARPAKAAPYPEADVEAAASALEQLEGVEVTASAMRAEVVDVTRPIHQVLRAPDLLGLFDTAPDLSGNDIDVAPFIRVTDQLDVQVAWQAVTGRPDPSHARPASDELCPVPIGELKRFADGRELYRFDHLEAAWVRVFPGDLRPGQVVVVDAKAGGYTPGAGWDPSSKDPVDPVWLPDKPGLVDQEEGVGDDSATFKRRNWIKLRRHLADVESVTADLLASLAPAGITASHVAAAVRAGRLHDIGKAHPVFQGTMTACASESDRPAVTGGAPWAKSGGTGRARHERRYFRHELASALALLHGASAGLDGIADADLALYLVAAHHGRVRLGIRSVPNEERGGTTLGVRDGDRLPAVDIPGQTLPASTLSLDVAHLGRAPDGTRSWAEIALGLRDRPDLGPFRLAFLEAVVRLADWRASEREEHEEGDL